MMISDPICTETFESLKKVVTTRVKFVTANAKRNVAKNNAGISLASIYSL